MSFSFSPHVPDRVRPTIRGEVQTWIDNKETPIISFESPVGEIDLICRPWPPIDGVDGVVCPEREQDRELLVKWAAWMEEHEEVYFLACEQHRPYEVFQTRDEAGAAIKPYLENGMDFQVAEVRVVAWHVLQIKWTKEKV